MGQFPGLSETTCPCIGQRYFPDAAADLASAAGFASAALMGTSFMPQIGQSPGLSDTTVGCIGQWYLTAAEPAAPWSSEARQPTQAAKPTASRMMASAAAVRRVVSVITCS